MRCSRFILPLFLALSLLTAQQSGAAHALSHALSNILAEQAETHGKQIAHSHHACEKCATYAQLGSSPIMGVYDVALVAVSSETIPYHNASSRFVHALVAVARGPPAARIL